MSSLGCAPVSSENVASFDAAPPAAGRSKVAGKARKEGIDPPNLDTTLDFSKAVTSKVGYRFPRFTSLTTKQRRWRQAGTGLSMA